MDTAIRAWNELAEWGELPVHVRALTPQPGAPILNRDDSVSLRRTILATLAEVGER